MSQNPSPFSPEAVPMNTKKRAKLTALIRTQIDLQITSYLKTHVEPRLPDPAKSTQGWFV